MTFGLPGDVDRCHALLARGSKSFSAAGKLLPREVRDRAAVLYAFCRLADDAIDEGKSADRVERLAERVERVFEGKRLEGPVERAFSDLASVHGLSKGIFDAMVEGFAWDAAKRRYETIEEVRAYAVRVASTVGVAMCAILEARAPHLLARAADLGLAMQLTNIARDVREDAGLGRVYLPGAWLREAGVDPDAIAASNPEDFDRAGFGAIGGPVRRVTLRLLVEADHFYSRADHGLRSLPLAVRPSMFAARLIYADIGRVIRSAEAPLARAVVPGPRKAALALLAITKCAGTPDATLFAPAAPEAQGLIDAAITGRS